MKTRKYIVIALCTALFGLTSCNDMLDLQPYGQFTEDMLDESLADGSAVEGLLASTYAGLEAHYFGNNEAFAGPSTNWIFDVRSDDALKGGGGISMEGNIHQLEISNIFSDNVSILNKWQNNYYAISRANNALSILNQVESIDNKEQLIGELKTLRAYYYFDLLRLFKYLPYITEKDDANTVDNKTYTQEDIYGFIKQDLEEAYQLMSDKEPAPGRFCRYSAAAIMVKVSAQTSDWDNVIKYADYVIGSGKYALYPRFQDMSKIDFNNTYESIIALQTSTASDNAHINWSNLLNKTYSVGNIYGTGDDFFYGSQNLVDAFRTDDNGLPYLENAPAEHVSETYAGNVDPRLDFTVGRIGFPWRSYTDGEGFTTVYTIDWCRTPDVYGEYSNKKDCVDPTDDRMVKGFPWGGSPLNFNFIRYADILLLKAEASVEKGDLSTALTLVNDVREKAKRSIDTDYVPVDLDVNKANYKVEPYPSFASQDEARKAVRMERRLELALEGHRWFDLVRWGEVVNTMNAYFASESQFHSYYGDAQMTEDEIFFPTPYVEVLNSNGLYK